MAIVSAAVWSYSATANTSENGTGPVRLTDPPTDEQVAEWVQPYIDGLGEAVNERMIVWIDETMANMRAQMWLAAVDQQDVILNNIAEAAWKASQGIVAVNAESDAGAAGVRRAIATDRVGCPGDLVPLTADTVLLPAPDTDVQVFTVGYDDGTYRGVGRDAGLPDGASYQVRLTVLCQ